MKTTVSIMILAASVALITSCQKEKWPCKKGRGDIQTETRSEKLFTDLEIDIAADVYITQDISATTSTIRVEAQGNILDNLKTDVSGNTLKVYFNHCVRRADDVKIYITTAQPEEVQLNGSGNIQSLTTLVTSRTDIKLMGSGNIDMTVETSNVVIDIAGSGNVTLSGTASSEKATITGSGNINTYALPVSTADVLISGSGDCRVNVTDELDIRISGSGSVSYLGNPVLHQDISGSGSVTNGN